MYVDPGLTSIFFESLFFIAIKQTSFSLASCAACVKLRPAYSRNNLESPRRM